MPILACIATYVYICIWSENEITSAEKIGHIYSARISIVSNHDSVLLLKSILSAVKYMKND